LSRYLTVPIQFDKLYTMFYLRHCSELQGYFINTNSSALSRKIYF